MPTLTASGPTGIVDLAGRLAASLNEGRAARESFGARDVAFGWSDGLPNILGRVVSNAVVTGLSFNAVRVSASDTPATKVAEGGTKPDAVTLSAAEVSLSKYAGLATISTEQSLTVEALTSALARTITGSCLLAYDADCVAQLAADAGSEATGSTWSEAILSGIAAVVGQGAAPSVLVLSAADYAAAVTSPGVGFAADPTNAAITLFGLSVLVSASAEAGTGYVLDPSACLACENESSPLAVVDPYSRLDVNEIRLAVEMFAGFVVGAPAGVAKVSVSSGS